MRFLYSGIAARIIIRERKNHTYEKYDIHKEKEVVLKKMNEIIDISLYNVKLIRNSIILEIKEEIYDNYIHDLIKEIIPYMESVNFIDNKTIDFNQFNQTNYPIHIGKYIKKSKYGKTEFIENDNGYYYVNMDKDNSTYDISADYSDKSSSLLFYHDNKYDLFDITIDYMRVGVITKCYEKEYDLRLVSILNEFSKSFFKTKLSKALLFYTC